MTPYFKDRSLTLFAGDCREVMPQLPEASVDAIVTDPPYDLVGASRNGSRRINNPDTPAGRHGRGFMGHEWDGTGVAFEVATWEAALRLARPGAWMLVFGGRRTHHRVTCAIEDGGWEVFEEIIWLFAQGMPKGRSTLKPAHEPIVMARKPADRVQPLQIDEARIPFAGGADEAESKGKNRHADYGTEPGGNHVFGDYTMVPRRNYTAEGRWPATVVLTDPVLDAGTADVVASRAETTRGHVPASRPASMFQANGQPATDGEEQLDVGSYSRYFLIPKAGRVERNIGLEGLDGQPILWSSGTKSPGTFQSPGTKRAARNHHPTVKPLELLSHLVRLVTPRRGAVLDPFLGSGTTAVAAAASGRRCIGIELDPSYLPIAPRRLRLLRGSEVPG
jgi:site-specific DNA-methyltransferase (adenine-specific)